MRKPRTIVVLEGSPEHTRLEAAALLQRLESDDALWVTEAEVPPTTALVAPRTAVKRLLGRSFDAVVLDLHDNLDADLLGQCHGFVRAPGPLVILAGTPPRCPALAAYPYTTADVGDRMFERVVRCLRKESRPAHLVYQTPEATHGTVGQRDLVTALSTSIRTPGVVIVTADRGRGKSAALGMLAASCRGRIAVTAASENATREVFAFAGERPLEFVRAPDLLEQTNYDLIIVDEAAQLPVALLRRLVEHHVDKPVILATTTHGYEGTGRGFMLRFVESLPQQVQHFRLTEPIRWPPNDPVESAVFEALLLDAEAARAPAEFTTLRHRRLSRTELATDEKLLRQVYGLLVHAHYRTTPGDLQRMLDAPNLTVHATFAGETVVAATLVAAEGELPDDLIEQLSTGASRLPGHALPDTFAAHLGFPDAARLRMARSVRIATHPDARRHGIASELVRHVHASYKPDLFGTLFGATAGLLRFRRSLGYQLLRVSASRGRHTGLPSVVMVRPRSDAAVELCRAVRAELARDLPVQLELLQAGNELRLAPALIEALLQGLEVPTPLSDKRRDELVRSYAFGPRTFESTPVAVASFAADKLDHLNRSDRALVEARVLRRTSWAEAMVAAQLPTIPATMRALRRAIRSLLDE